MGESTLFINGNHIVNVSRWGPKYPWARMRRNAGATGGQCGTGTGLS